jgi:YidC/Oxa1 family membrane protein insertase
MLALLSWQSYEEKLLKIASRFSWLCAATILLGVLLSGCNSGPQGEEPLTLEHAEQLETQADPQKAVDEYAAIRNAYNTKDPQIAAEALLESARLTSNHAKYGTLAQLKITDDPAHLSAAARESLDAKWEQGEDLARESLKQLVQNYPNSMAAQEAIHSGFKQHIDDVITRRNSKKTSYKIVDALVAFTGRKPGFSYWFALAIIAVALKVITFPLLLKTYQSQREMQKMQPIIKEIQAKYKDEPQEAFKQQQAAFKEHGVNQFASCIPALIQMPIFFWMYSLIRVYETSFSKGQFLWVNPAFAHKFPGIIAPNLAQLDFPLLILYAGTMLLTMRMTPQTDPAMAQQQKSMSVMMTFMMIWWFMQSKWPSAFLLYYLIQNILSAVQQYYFIYRPAKDRMATAGAGGAAGMTIDVPPVAKTSSLVDRIAPGANGTAKSNGMARPNRPDKAADAATPISATAMKPRPKRKSGKNR